MAIYDVSGTQEDCYPGTTVLVNRFDIQDQDKLSLVEQKLVTGLAAQLQESVNETNQALQGGPDLFVTAC